MSIGEKIRELRQERGWSQRELEERAGINKRLVSRYELGLAKPTLDGLEKLAKVFNVSTDYLYFGKTGQKTIGDHEFFELLKQADDFSPENRQLAKDLLRALIAKNREEAQLLRE